MLYISGTVSHFVMTVHFSVLTNLKEEIGRFKALNSVTRCPCSSTAEINYYGRTPESEREVSGTAMKG